MLLAPLLRYYGRALCHRFMVVVMIASAVLLASCQSSSLGQPPAPTLLPHTHAPPLAPWTQAWLLSDPCRSPCWYGITPGETRNADAFAILQSLPFVDQATISGYQSGQEKVWSWRWTAPIQGSGQLRRDKERITRILLHVDESLPLDMIIEHLGFPRVKTREDRFENGPLLYTISLSWPDDGIVLGITDTTPPDLHPHTVFENSVTLFARKEPEEPTITPPWRGYYSYQYYAKRQP